MAALESQAARRAEVSASGADRYHIPKYRIVFGTDHEDALLLMVDNMNNRWAKFREDARNNQFALFEIEFPNPSKQRACRDIENEIVTLLGTGIELKDLLVSLTQKFGINYSVRDYVECLKHMENNQIEVTRTPPLTPTAKPCSSWDHTKKDLSIKISRRAQWQPPPQEKTDTLFRKLHE